jgi:4-aminobutyrate aminotransferase-like enzyme
MTTSGSDGVFASLEPRVRSYRRSWPAVFDRAFGCTVYDESGRGYLDFDGMPGEVSLLERMPADPGSGLDRTAAVIVETVQGEGGLNAARRVAARPGGPVLTARRAVGGGRRANGVRRTGPFFSFESAGVTPDMSACPNRSVDSDCRWRSRRASRGGTRAAFGRGLLVETAGPDGEVVKLMPPLVVTEAETQRGLAILRQCTHEVLRERTESTENP